MWGQCPGSNCTALPGCGSWGCPPGRVSRVSKCPQAQEGRHRPAWPGCRTAATASWPPPGPSRGPSGNPDREGQPPGPGASYSRGSKRRRNWAWVATGNGRTPSGYEVAAREAPLNTPPPAPHKHHCPSSASPWGREMRGKEWGAEPKEERERAQGGPERGGRRRKEAADTGEEREGREETSATLSPAPAREKAPGAGLPQPSPGPAPHAPSGLLAVVSSTRREVRASGKLRK